MLALLKGRLHRTAEELKQLNKYFSKDSIFTAAIKKVSLGNGIISNIEEEVNKVRHHNFRPLTHQYILKMIVGDRVILDKNFTDNAHLRLAESLVNLNGVKLLDKRFNVPSE